MIPRQKILVVSNGSDENREQWVLEVKRQKLNMSIFESTWEKEEPWKDSKSKNEMDNW